jgi:putative ATPase
MLADLFDTTDDTRTATKSASHEPLASRMRPRTLDEYIGQDHIVGKGRLLRRAIAADQLTSVIFYGPPGSGKTTLARVIANHTKSNFITLNAVLTGVANIRDAIANAEEQRKLYDKKTILFVDEVHRWNKSQQDALLPWVENGTIILIGATTENPFFEVNKALVSRSRVFQLKSLTKDDLFKAAHQALTDADRGYGHWNVVFEEGALEHLVETANGDARSLLNALELAVETTPERWNPSATPPVPAWGTTIYISRETAEESIQKKVVLYDRDGDYHYDIISAFIKSLRGRDPDAAMYWLARMVKAGEDPDFIFRRMMISACEDTGLADPNAITVVQNCAAAFDRVGMPEGRYFLAHAALYLSTAPKSNSAMAFFDALASVEKEDADVPNHLRDASRDAEGFGHGAGYLYPHAYRDHWVAQQYLPDTLVGRVFYTPTTQGYEANIREDVLSRREVQIAAIMEEQNALFSNKKTVYNEQADKHPGTGTIFNKQSDDNEDMVNPISEWWLNEHFKGGSIKKEENLTFSPEDKGKEATLDKAERSWRTRIDSNKAELLLQIRNTITELAHIVRHHRSLIWNADDALLLFDITRKTPEGLTCGLCRTQKGIDVLTQYASTLGDLDKPHLALLTKALLAQHNVSSFSASQLREAFNLFGDVVFDRLFFRDLFASTEDIQNFAKILAELSDTKPQESKNISFGDEDTFRPKAASPFAEGAVAIFSQRIPCHGQRLSALISKQIQFDPQDAKLIDAMAVAEEAFFNDKTNPLFSFDAEVIQSIFSKAGCTVTSATQTLVEKRRITEQDITHWFTVETSAYAANLSLALTVEGLSKIRSIISAAAKKQLFDWQIENTYLAVGLK